MTEPEKVNLLIPQSRSTAGLETTNGIGEHMPKAPKLAELKKRECTLPELQAALVQLIELHNGMHDEINRMIDVGRIRSTREANMNKPYGL